MLKPNYISFRDRVARVVKKGDSFYRYISYEYKLEYDHLMKSGLYRELIQNELLIEHQEIEIDTDDSKVYKLLLPTQISFQSYPFEWSYNQWRKVILAYLKINLISLKYGMMLKDATPFNFYLSGGKAVMFDTSSFIFFKENDKWVAYSQFCSEFLSPLTLMHYNGQRWSRLTRTHLRGLPINFVSKQLPIKSWFNINTLLHIHIHAKYTNEKYVNRKRNNIGFTAEKLKTLLSMLQSNILGWETSYQFEKHWSEYYENDIESEDYLTHKEDVIKQWLNQLKPISVLDLGANSGKFSFIAEKYTQKVVALESDDICVDIIERNIEKEKLKAVHAILIDLAEASSNLGVLNKEYSSIFTRANSEMLIALAIVHHLHISNQLCFSQIAEMFSVLSSNYLIVEFIPITDSKVQFLIKDRQIDLINYNEEHFTSALSKWFNIKEAIDLKDSMRSLYLLEKKK